MLRNAIILTILILAAMPFMAQSVLPDVGYVFDDNSVPRIDILIDPADFNMILSNVESNEEYPATFVFTTPAGSDTVENVGFRVRGNTSRWSQKKSWKISFNTFEAGRKFYGLEKMNINGEHNDPSIMRAKICWDMMRFMEVPASRANHVALYINDEYYGVYLNVEHIDEEFVRSRFGDNHGNLYKCLWPADLDYLDSNGESYRFENEGRRAYDLKTNVEYQDYNDLARFITVLHDPGGDDFTCALNEVFNVADYLKIAAVDVLTGNWDNYIYLKNNFYLYLNPESGRMEFIPYDMDNTFGVDWFDIDWASRDIYNWSMEEPRPLYEKIMSEQVFRDQFSYYVEFLLDNYFSTEKMQTEISRIHNMIRPYVIDDPHYPLDYGYSVDDFDRSLDQVIGAHVKSGIYPFINSRATYARGQLQVNDIRPVMGYFDWNQPDPGDTLFVRMRVEDDNLKDVSLMFALFDGPYEKMEMFDDGNHADGGAGDGVYGTYMVQKGIWDASFFASVSDHSGHVIDYPCDPVHIAVPLTSKGLMINEFMASNNSSVADEAGEYDDWIEIINIGSEPQWLGARFLSDNLSNRDKWRLPEHWLYSGEYVVIWADGQDDQGDMHTNFKLSRAGEEIGLFDAPSTGFRVIDRIRYSEQATDVSFGRSADGGNEWIAIATSTPGESNHISSTGLARMAKRPILVYPNPVDGDLVLFSQPATVKVYDIQGRLCLELLDRRRADIGSLVSGMYLLLFDNGETVRLIRH